MTFEEDPELLARLMAADPAAHLPPADPSRVARLLEDTMNTPHTEADAARSDHPAPVRGRSPLAWIAAAAAVAALAGGGFWMTRGDDSAPAVTPTVTTLDSPPDPGAAKCQVPNAELLATQAVAFDGTVTSLADGVATLEVARWYAGDETDLVAVKAPNADLQQLLLAVDFQEGKRYLVSALDGQVSVCGFSGEYSTELAALYDEAFGG